MVKGRKPKVQATTNAQKMSTGTTKKTTAATILVNNMLSNDTNGYHIEDNCFNSPKRKETKIDVQNRMIVENAQITNGKPKPYQLATRSTRKINSYFARLPGNGIIKVQNGRRSGSHSDENSCDSYENTASCSYDDQNNNPPSSASFDNILQQHPNGSVNGFGVQSSIPDPKQSKQQKMTNPTKKLEAQTSNLFLQEPVLKLEFDSSATNNGHNLENCIKSSFLSTEIKSKFQTLPPTEYINKVLNVNGTHDDDIIFHNGSSSAKDPPVYLLNSDSNSSDSGVVIGGSNGVADKYIVIDDTTTRTFEMKSPMNNMPNRRRKPTTPHRIMCPSPVKASSQSKLAHRTEAEKIQLTSRSRNRVRVKLPITEIVPTNDVITVEDHEEKFVIPQCDKLKTKPARVIAAADNQINKKVTEFFPVRRSVRKTKKEVQEERMRNIEQAIREEREEGLAIKEFPNKGRGIVTTRPFQRGEFVIEYIGDLISMSKANDREQFYAEDDNTGCYMYYFKHNDQQYCIDATAETGKLGRLVNHSRNGNLSTKTVMVHGRPHLVLIAKDDLPVDVELTYDYGDRSKEALQHHPWLAL